MDDPEEFQSALRGKLLQDPAIESMLREEFSRDGGILIDGHSGEIVATWSIFFPQKSDLVFAGHGTRHNYPLHVAASRECIIIVRSQDGYISVLSSEHLRKQDGTPRCFRLNVEDEPRQEVLVPQTLLHPQSVCDRAFNMPSKETRCLSTSTSSCLDEAHYDQSIGKLHDEVQKCSLLTSDQKRSVHTAVDATISAEQVLTESKRLPDPPRVPHTSIFSIFEDALIALSEVGGPLVLAGLYYFLFTENRQVRLLRNMITQIKFTSS